MVVLSFMCLQPLGGYMAHRYFKSTGGPNWLGFAHAWFGRSLLIIGAINGSLGLQLTEVRSPAAPMTSIVSADRNTDAGVQNSPDGTIAYAVLMSLIVASYLVVVFATRGWQVGGKTQLGRSAHKSPASSTADEKRVERSV